MVFYLGTHRPGWIGRLAVPLFVSARTLRERRPGGRALAPWAIDSGGFTELNRSGCWETPAGVYGAEVDRWAETIGNVAWAAPQDWMCEPFVLAKTGQTVRDHQQRTIESVLELRATRPHLPFAPVLQGWTIDDYLDHVDQYAAAGFDLAAEPIVGVGSVCRRQRDTEIDAVMRALARFELRLHGFGVKTSGLDLYGEVLASSDSMAWSFDARYNDPLPGCEHRGRCTNCPRYALRWRDELLSRPQRPQRQLGLL